MKPRSSHAKDRAKKILRSDKTSAPVMDKKSVGKSIGLSGAAPTAFPIKGKSSKTRLDKRQRLATGGGVEDDMPKKKGSPKTEVNIVIAGKGDQGAAPPPPPMMPPPGAMPPPPPRPPMGMPPGGGMPPGAGMKPPGMMKRGGGVKEPKYPIDGGAGGGEGRLEKAAAQKSRRGKGGD